MPCQDLVELGVAALGPRRRIMAAAAMDAAAPAAASCGSQARTQTSTVEAWLLSDLRTQALHPHDSGEMSQPSLASLTGF